MTFEKQLHFLMLQIFWTIHLCNEITFQKCIYASIFYTTFILQIEVAIIFNSIFFV